MLVQALLIVVAPSRGEQGGGVATGPLDGSSAVDANGDGITDPGVATDGSVGADGTGALGGADGSGAAGGTGGTSGTSGGTGGAGGSGGGAAVASGSVAHCK